MASAPTFAATPNVGSIALGGFDTSLTAPSTIVTLITGAANGTKVEEIILQGTGTTVAGVCNIFLYDGSTYHLYDQILITAVTSSTIAIAFRQNKQCANLIVKNGWTLRASHTVTGNDTNKLSITGTAGDI